MKSFTRMLIKCFVALVVALTLMVSLVGIYGSTSYAAPLSAAHVQAKPQSTAPLRLVPGSYISLSIVHVSGRTVTFSAQWGGGTWVQSDIMFYSGDGSSDDYTCWLNCASGSTTFIHTYPRANTNYRASDQLLVGGYVWATNYTWVLS